MAYRIAADAVVVLHAVFVLFAVLGALLVLRWRRLAWLHVPAAVWAVLIEYAGWICPLTPLENHFRRLSGQRGYRGGFVEHYVMPVLYPEGLTSRHQLVLGSAVLLLNVAIYGYLVWGAVRRRQEQGS